MNRLLTWLILAFSIASSSMAGPGVTEDAGWNGLPRRPVQVGAHAGFVVSPKAAAPGKPWVWRTSFPGYHAEVDMALVSSGFHVAYVNVLSMLGSEGALDVMDQFYDIVRKDFGLAEKPALEAVSRGGLHAYRYAARHPERIACIYADVPVMDLKSWPLKAKAGQPLQDAMNFYDFKSEEELKAFQGNPLDLLAPIAAAKIPLRHVICLNDETVPPEENTQEARRRLNKLGWDIDLVIVQQGDAKTKGHHFPLPEAAESTCFILKHTIAERQAPAAQSKPKAAESYTPKQDIAGLTSDTPIDKALPNVLILGDSISIGYTRQVREGLKGKANVIRPNANCGDTRNGLAQIEAWLGDGKWQVIHFNWGLHDLCYRNPDLNTPGQRDKIKGTLSVSLPEYEKNLESLVERLMQTGAKLIFANTTLVPEGEEGRFVGDEVKYNAVAAHVMNRHGVLINDLHATTQAFPPAMFAGPRNVHFSAAGSAQLAAQVVAKVEAALAPVPPPAAAQSKSVLFIGDAAGAQYAERLRDFLKPRIELHFLSAPRGGKAQRDAFLGELAALVARHDLVLYAGGLEAARVSLETGKPELGSAQFRQFLEELSKADGRGRKSGGKTKWIWATAVPVPEGHATFSAPQNAACNLVLIDLAYNRHAILLDLHEYVRIRREDMQRPGDFLLSEPGVTLIASVVANKIEEVALEGSEPSLPNVLVLGDSIVGQYSTFLRGSLLHKANVRTGGTAFDQRPAWPEIVRQQVTEAERELGRPFDLIQFNWGLHALKWAKGGDYSMELKAGYERCVPPDRYGEELEKLVAELAKTGRRLVFATTTPANNGSQPDDAFTYNSIAMEVMRRHHIPVNDLGAFVVAGKLPMQGCHYPRESAEQLAQHVAGQLLRILSEPTQ